MTNNRKDLDILGNLKYFFLLVIILVGVLLVLNSLAEKRKREMTKKYYDEALTYIAQNQEGLETIFKDGFSTRSASLKIDSLISPNLKDYSSTFFIKETTPNRVEYLMLSKDTGNFDQYQIFQSDNKIIDLLNGKYEFLPWDEYTYLLNTKEVVIAVKDRSGKTIGALVRGVIE